MVIESADLGRAAPQRNRLQVDVLRRMACFDGHIASPPLAIFCCRAFIGCGDHQDDGAARCPVLFKRRRREVRAKVARSERFKPMVARAVVINPGGKAVGGALVIA